MKRKIPSLHRELNPRTQIVQPIAQHYTNWAVTALFSEQGTLKCQFMEDTHYKSIGIPFGKQGSFIFIFPGYPNFISSVLFFLHNHRYRL
jgi:hypothetical protein